MMKNITLILMTLISCVSFPSWALLSGEGIVLDRNTGDYIITYANAAGRLKQSRFVPSTKINPTLNSRFEIRHGAIRYRYSIKNGVSGKQPLIGFIFDPVSSIYSNGAVPETRQQDIEKIKQLASDPVRLGDYINAPSGVVEAPQGWSCDVIPNGEAARSHFRIPCSFDDLDEGGRNGLQVGSSLGGFGFFSLDLPGVGIGQVRGFGDIGLGFTDEGPNGEISDQLDVLVEKDFVARNAAVPTIAVPFPFDAATLIDRIRTHVATWPSKQLADAAVVAQLDAELVATATAYRANQPQVARDHIEILLDMIRREHKDIDRDDDEEHDNKRAEKEQSRKATTQPIRLDRLAARVLDFDLKYVLKRMKKDEDEREHKKH